jgi:hypothetical protein
MALGDTRNLRTTAARFSRPRSCSPWRGRRRVHTRPRLPGPRTGVAADTPLSHEYRHRSRSEHQDPEIPAHAGTAGAPCRSLLAAIRRSGLGPAHRRRGILSARGAPLEEISRLVEHSGFLQGIAHAPCVRCSSRRVAWSAARGPLADRTTRCEASRASEAGSLREGGAEAGDSLSAHVFTGGATTFAKP